MCAVIANFQTSTARARISTWRKYVLTWLKEWLKRWWMWVLGAMSALGLYVVARSSGKRDGRASVIYERLKTTLQDIDHTKSRLDVLHQKKIDLTAEVARLAAERTKVLQEDLTDEEVKKRLREKGFIK